jgi:hypothetical protein
LKWPHRPEIISLTRGDFSTTSALDKIAGNDGILPLGHLNKLIRIIKCFEFSIW